MYRRRPLLLLGLTIAASLVLTACGAGQSRTESTSTNDTIGVTDDAVVIGAHAPLTGVVSPGYSDIPAGAQAYFDHVNAQGGVHGRELRYIVRDDAYNPSTTSQVVRELVQQDGVFAIVGGFGTPTHRAVVDFLNDERVPDVFPVSGSLQWGDPALHPYTFGWQPDYEIEGKIFGEWIAQNRPQARVGLFLQDDDLGEGGEVGLRRYIDDQIVSVQRYSSTNTNVAPQIAALKAAGADLVVAFDTPSFTALSQLAALKVDYDPEWVVTRVGSNPDLVGPLLARFSDGTADAGSILDGMITNGYMPEPHDETDAWAALWRQVWQEHGDDAPLDSYRVTGMAIAYTFVQALSLAGEDPTRTELMGALERMGGAGVANPAFSPYRYSENDHRGMTGIRVLRVAGGEISEQLTPTLVTGNGDTPITVDGSGASEDVPPLGGVPSADGR